MNKKMYLNCFLKYIIIIKMHFTVFVFKKKLDYLFKKAMYHVLFTRNKSHEIYFLIMY